MTDLDKTVVLEKPSSCNSKIPDPGHVPGSRKGDSVMTNRSVGCFHGR